MIKVRRPERRKKVACWISLLIKTKILAKKLTFGDNEKTYFELAKKMMEAKGRNIK